MQKKRVKEYCKMFKIKIKKIEIVDGIITSFTGVTKVPIFAGMKYNPVTGESGHSTMKKVGEKHITNNFLVYASGDVVEDRIIAKKIVMN